MADKILKIWPELKVHLATANADDVTLKAIEATLNQQCQHALSIADNIPKVSNDLL